MCVCGRRVGWAGGVVAYMLCILFMYVCSLLCMYYVDIDKLQYTILNVNNIEGRVSLLVPASSPRQPQPDNEQQQDRLK